MEENQETLCDETKVKQEAKDEIKIEEPEEVNIEMKIEKSELYENNEDCVIVQEVTTVLRGVTEHLNPSPPDSRKEEARIVCSRCGKELLYPFDELNGSLSCSSCRGELSALNNRYSKGNYKKDPLIIIGLNPYKCSVCHERFSALSKLRRHYIGHSVEPLYHCGKCNEGFTFMNEYKQHMLMHTEERFTCSICNKFFKSCNYLQIHLNTHKKEHPYQCSICKKAYTTKYVLRRHENKHKQTI